jgi:hypothetical protein
VATLTACLVGVLAFPAAASASLWHLDVNRPGFDGGGGY